jgi:hypothetical protein
MDREDAALLACRHASRRMSGLGYAAVASIGMILKRPMPQHGRRLLWPLSNNDRIRRCSHPASRYALARVLKYPRIVAAGAAALLKGDDLLVSWQ